MWPPNYVVRYCGIANMASVAVDKSSVRKGRDSICIRHFSTAPTAAAAAAATTTAMVTKFRRVPN